MLIREQGRLIARSVETLPVNEISGRSDEKGAGFALTYQCFILAHLQATGQYRQRAE